MPLRGSIVSSRVSAFTLVELLIGVSLALMIMTAVLTSYVTLARNFTRSLGVTSANQPTLESQSRRALAYFAQDVAMATGLSGTPSASSLTLTLPTSAGTTTVTYSYDNVANTFTRTPSGGTAQVLQSNITTNGFAFRYFDATGNPYDNGSAPYTTVTTYAAGIKQVSLTFSVQAGSSTNGTLTAVFQVASPRFLFRNKSLLQ